MFLILIRRETEEGTLTWIDEGYNTTEEDKDTDISAYTEIFGTGNVRLVSSLEWEQEQEAVSLEKEEEEMARQKLRKQQESEYRKCLRADKQAESEEHQNHPSIEELRRLRCQHFDFSNRRMTRSSNKKLGIRSKKV